MNPSPCKNRKWLLIFPAAYLAVLSLLTLAERSAPDASIRTFADALWYSLVTMSTVGYGDLYPVTALGRSLGAVFILLSLGLFAFLMGLLIRIVTGSLLPAIRLRAVRGKTWYIFSCRNSAAFALAKHLACQEPDCVLLFPADQGDVLPEQLPHLLYTGSPEAVAAKKKDGCMICFMDEEDPYEQAVSALQTGHPVYCRTVFAPDVCPQNLTLFNPYDCCARRYWQDHGLKPGERTVLLIGDGKFARELLTRGLLLNVYGPGRKTDYHIFGSWEHYLNNHHRLSKTLSPEGTDPDEDCLHFHRTDWNEDRTLLASADRIILCQDSREENTDILGQLHRYFLIRGDIHLLCRSDIPGLSVFGTEDTVYTPQLVLQSQLNRAARTLHRIYSEAYGADAPGWEQLSEFQRQSNIAAAGHLLTKIRILLADDTIRAITPDNCRAAYERYLSYSDAQKEICRLIEHRRWMRFHSMYNWCYAPVRNNAAREHPLMLPYEDLAPEEQAKDDFAWELLKRLADQTENN